MSSFDGLTQSAAVRLDATRAQMQEAMEPGRAVRAAARVPALPPRLGTHSASASVAEGVQAWWDKSTVGRTVQAVGPLVEPYLKPLIRDHHRELLLGSAAVGALVSLFPGKSARAALRIAGPLLISSVMLEIAKAGFRQLRKPQDTTSSS